MKLNNYRFHALTISLLLITSCDLFELSPYEVPNLHEFERNRNYKNIEEISGGNNADNDSFYFEAGSLDSYMWYYFKTRAFDFKDIWNLAAGIRIQVFREK